MIRQPLALVIGALLTSGCSAPAPGGQDASLADLPSCGADTYPCGPYGTKAGKIAQNMTFSGFADPQNACKAHRDKVFDLSQVRPLSFKDWYQGDPTCGNKRRELLWVVVLIGSCTSCRTKLQALQANYASGAIDERLAIFNILYETDKLHEPVTEAFTKQWIKYYGLTFPVGMDPGFKMGAYFSGDTTPYTMMIDLSSMKIVYGQTGWDPAKIDALIAGFLQK